MGPPEYGEWVEHRHMKDTSGRPLRGRVVFLNPQNPNFIVEFVEPWVQDIRDMTIYTAFWTETIRRTTVMDILAEQA